MQCRRTTSWNRSYLREDSVSVGRKNIIYLLAQLLLARYSCGAISVCCLKYLWSVKCSEKFNSAASSLTFFNTFSNRSFVWFIVMSMIRSWQSHLSTPTFEVFSSPWGYFPMQKISMQRHAYMSAYWHNNLSIQFMSSGREVNSISVSRTFFRFAQSKQTRGAIRLCLYKWNRDIFTAQFLANIFFNRKFARNK